MAATQEEGRKGREPGTVSTYLVIPYFAGDRGRPGQERPLGGNAVWWLCPSIVVNGQPGKNTFVRGEPTSVTVDVANWGNGTIAAPVQVQLWWADPTTGFTTKTPFGQTVVVAPTGGGVRRSPPVVGVIPTSAPAHVCLLAYVSSPLDALPAGSPADPVGDRHWAQLNIVELAQPAAQPFQLLVFVGNPLAEEATFELVERALSRETLAVLSRIRRAEVVTLEGPTLELWEGRRRGEGNTLRVTLEPGRRRAVHVAGKLPDDVEPGLDVAFELVQTLPGEEEPRVTGAIGLIVQRRRER